MIIVLLFKQLFLVSKTVFGESQSPKLWDYADGVDTIDFLLNV